MKLVALFIAGSLALAAAPAVAGPLTVDLAPAKSNPASPQMGDNLLFHTSIRNQGRSPIDGIIAWISLVQIDKGKEQPVDLEDWSAHKAVTVATLASGQSIETDWPMRLIQAGEYRAVVSAVSRAGGELVPSQFADFSVRQKPVVESRRVLPVALGVPAILGLAILLSLRRRR
ncbi:MAG: hypothetical protein ACOY3L_05580 [Pseudomonadota bacterium]